MAIVTRRAVVPNPQDPRVVLRRKLINDLWATFEPRWQNGLPEFCLVADKAYYTLRKSEAQDIARTWAANRQPYMADRYDCDDYAWEFKTHLAQRAARLQIPLGYAVGMIWTETSTEGAEGHAYNWVYTDTGLIWLIEPQSGDMWRPRTRRSRQGEPNYDWHISLVCG